MTLSTIHLLLVVLLLLLVTTITACHCEDGACACCLTMPVLRQEACVRLTATSSDALVLALSVGTAWHVATLPMSVAAGAPPLRICSSTLGHDVCAHVTNVHLSAASAHACLAVGSTFWGRVVVADMALGCVTVPLLLGVSKE